MIHYFMKQDVCCTFCIIVLKSSNNFIYETRFCQQHGIIFPHWHKHFFLGVGGGEGVILEQNILCYNQEALATVIHSSSHHLK